MRKFQGMFLNGSEQGTYREIFKSAIAYLYVETSNQCKYAKYQPVVIEECNLNILSTHSKPFRRKGR